MTATIVIGAPSSGQGKTTITCGIIAALSARGYDVRCYKCGPDFIDGLHHQAAVQAGRRIRHEQKTASLESSGGEDDDDGQEIIGRPAPVTRMRTANLDGWMQGSPRVVLETFHRHSSHSLSVSKETICIVEGVMGLHDSRNGKDDQGSTAQIAKILGAPVVLVLDASACARSVAATALGHATFDPQMRMGGVIANMVGGTSHKKWIQESIESISVRLKDCHTNRPVQFLGNLPRDAECAIPERHLGLHLPGEESREATERRYDRLVTLIEEHLDLDAILDLARTTAAAPNSGQATAAAMPKLISKPKYKCKIGIADDAAFCFYYADNLHLLAQAGAELVSFSPISSTRLPPGIDGLYFGGGYPELYAEKLEENIALRKEIKSFCDSGATVFAECGGFMYLADALIVISKGDNKLDPQSRSMCGVFPGLVIRMTKQCTMSYATIEITNSNPVFGTGSSCNPTILCRGQEFHYSTVVEETSIISPSLRNTSRGPPVRIKPELPGADFVPGGFAHKNTFASYLHFYFASKTTGITVGDDFCGSLADNFISSVTRNSPPEKQVSS